MAETSHDRGEDARIPVSLERLLANEENVLSQRFVDSGLYLGDVHEALDDLSENQVSALEGLTHEEVLGVLHKSNIIDCEAGDHVIKKGAPLRTCLSSLRAVSRYEMGTHCSACLARETFSEPWLFCAHDRGSSTCMQQRIAGS